MKIAKPSHNILIPESPYKHIEKIGRICYKSEDAITDTSAEPFVRRLFNSGHHAMLEHFRFIVEVGQFDYVAMHSSKYNKYLTFTNDNDRYIISASARGFNDMYHIILDNNDEDEYSKNTIEAIVTALIVKYDCKSLFDPKLYGVFPTEETGIRIIENFDELSDKEYNAHAWYSVHFVCDRGVTHEMVRHRDASFAQESTRYCNYSKGKYGNEITVIEPCFWKEYSAEYDMWKTTCQVIEHTYLYLIERGATPQEARSVLPNSLKTEIIITAQVYEWKHIFDLRVHGKTGAPHPQMKEVMEPVYNDMSFIGLIR